MKLNKNNTGITVALFFAIVHAAWALLVAVVPSMLQSSLDFIFNVHFLQPIWILTSFNIVYAIELVVITFVLGYIFGWVFAWAHNLHHKKD